MVVFVRSGGIVINYVLQLYKRAFLSGERCPKIQNATEMVVIGYYDRIYINRFDDWRGFSALNTSFCRSMESVVLFELDTQSAQLPDDLFLMIWLQIKPSIGNAEAYAKSAAKKLQQASKDSLSVSPFITAESSQIALVARPVESDIPAGHVLFSAVEALREESVVYLFPMLCFNPNRLRQGDCAWLRAQVLGNMEISFAVKPDISEEVAKAFFDQFQEQGMTCELDYYNRRMHFGRLTIDTLAQLHGPDGALGRQAETPEYSIEAVCSGYVSHIYYGGDNWNSTPAQGEGAK